MATVSKYIKINPKILIQWDFDSNNFVSENYKVITNLNENKKKSFLSTTLLNSKDRNLFEVDSIVRKYAVVSSDYNYLQEQDFSSSPAIYDRVKVFLPTNYNFDTEGYIGFYVKTFAYNINNTLVTEFSNIFYDNTDAVNGGSTLLNLAIPFIYDEVEWGKYFEFEIPSINYVSNQRNTSGSITQPNTINYNVTNDNVGISQTAPIFIDFRFLTSKETILDVKYYYATEEYRMSIPKSPEFETLAVKIEESSEGDFFEIYGTYGEASSNMDNFIAEMETKGRRVKIEYDVYLYEENLQTSLQTYSVVDNFDEPILYRPIMTFANNTAAIKVTMKIIDLVDMSQTERFTTLGIRDSVHKYGKKLISLNVGDFNTLKIYNAKPEQIQMNNDFATSNITTEVRKVPYPLLIDVGKIIVNSPKSSKYYKGMGLLNLVITPFDNIIQFRIAELSGDNKMDPYNFSDILKDADLTLVFKSDSEIVEKGIFTGSENNFNIGIVNYKIDEVDISTLRSIYDKGYTNFYLALTAIKTNNKTLLYSGTFTFYENVKFVDDGSEISDDGDLTESPITASSTSTPSTSTTSNDWAPRAGKTLIIYTKSRASVTNTQSAQISAS
jgi:hypothetical protein